MKNIRRAIIAMCFLIFGYLAARAQTNTGYGTGALASNTTGVYNSAFGYDALYANTSGQQNTAVGVYTLDTRNTTSSDNTAIGYSALYENSTGDYNTATGDDALSSNLTGAYNTAAGAAALVENTTGDYNTAIGYYALWYDSSNANTAAGQYALESNTTGTGNTALGYQGLGTTTTGSYNTDLGVAENTTSGSYNISLGYAAGSAIYPYGYNYNIDIGNEGAYSDDGVIRIGGSPGSQSAFYGAGIYGVNVSGVPVYITSSGQLGIVSSSIRFKKDVQNMGNASSAIYRLRPVTYRYKKPFADGSDPVEYGLIAEEVARVYPDLVARNADGTIQTVAYQKLTPMMLNELQKQHRLREYLAKTIEQQQQTIQFLRAQQTELFQPLEKRLAALEGANSGAMRLDAQLEEK
jgi:hypothetical protein